MSIKGYGYSWFSNRHGNARIINVLLKINFNNNVFCSTRTDPDLNKRYVLEVNHVKNGTAELAIQLFEESNGLLVDLFDDVLCGEYSDHAFNILRQLLAV